MTTHRQLTPEALEKKAKQMAKDALVQYNKGKYPIYKNMLAESERLKKEAKKMREGE